MRVTSYKTETKQGRIISERAQGRSNGRLRSYRQLSCWRLSVLVEFLNQKYDEFGIAIWHRDTSLLGFLYGPHLDRPLTKEQLLEFYAETKRVQSEIIGLLENRRQLRNRINQAALRGEFSKTAYSLLFTVCRDNCIDKLAECKWCGQFFAKPHRKEKYCSNECYRLYNQKDSDRRHSKTRML